MYDDLLHVIGQVHVFDRAERNILVLHVGLLCRDAIGGLEGDGNQRAAVRQVSRGKINADQAGNDRHEPNK
jgi:hypothetical protein